MIKKILLGLAAVFVIIQFFHPKKNDSNDMTNDISKKYNVPTDVQAILKVACNNCHSNKTEYPWYANIQPLAWWMTETYLAGGGGPDGRFKIRLSAG